MNAAHLGLIQLPAGSIDWPEVHRAMRETFAELTADYGGSPMPVWHRRLYATHPELPHRLRLELTADLQLRLVAFRTGREIAICSVSAP